MSAATHPEARPALEAFCNEIAQLYPELVSLIAYGSAVTESFHSSHSNVNLLLVLPKVDAAVLARGAAAFRKHRKKGVIPLLISEQELRDSIDVFAVEFSDIQERHAVIRGINPFETLVIPGTWLRRQCEFELRGKHLRLRQGYLECGGEEKPLLALLVAVLGGVLPLGRSLLRLAGEAPPAERTPLIEALARRYGFPPGPLLEVLELKERRRRKPLRKAANLYSDFLGALDTLVNRIDSAT